MISYNNYIGSSWTLDFLHPKSLQKYIKKAIKKLSKLDKEYDTIAFCGMSGCMIAIPLAQALSKELILVRKKNEKCHSYYDVEGNIRFCKRYIIVDDFIESGTTQRHIKSKIFEEAELPGVTCIGMLEVTRDKYHSYVKPTKYVKSTKKDKK